MIPPLHSLVPLYSLHFHPLRSPCQTLSHLFSIAPTFFSLSLITFSFFIFILFSPLFYSAKGSTCFLLQCSINIAKRTSGGCSCSTTHINSKFLWFISMGWTRTGTGTHTHTHTCTISQSHGEMNTNYTHTTHIVKNNQTQLNTQTNASVHASTHTHTSKHTDSGTHP